MESGQGTALNQIGDSQGETPGLRAIEYNSFGQSPLPLLAIFNKSSEVVSKFSSHPQTAFKSRLVPKQMLQNSTKSINGLSPSEIASGNKIVALKEHLKGFVQKQPQRIPQGFNGSNYLSTEPLRSSPSANTKITKNT